MAAVIAAKFTAMPPQNAARIDEIPVNVNQGLGLISYPLAFITATPGIFCPAMVTTNSGTPNPKEIAKSKVGRTKSSGGNNRVISSVVDGL